MCFVWVEMRGGRGLFIGISNQSGTSRVAARVSLRMAPDTCAVAPRAPLVLQHGLLTCKVTPRPLPVWMHGLLTCKLTPRPPHVCRMAQSLASRHLVLGRSTSCSTWLAACLSLMQDDTPTSRCLLHY
ncbi:hypothetical protein YC2023_072142 [Brassica napus]